MSKIKNNIQIGRIVLHNYKSYKDQSIDLSRDNEKTITIIHGEMGKGKTTLLGAVYWCLYGKSRPHSVSSDENIINNNAIAKLDVGDSDESTVEVSLYEKDQLSYIVKRSIKFTKTHESSELKKSLDVDGTISEGIKCENNVELQHLLKNMDWDVKTDITSVKGYIENLFPSSLASYFLFDAELLNEFFEDEDEIHVKNGIEKISGLPIVEKTRDNIKKISKEIASDIKDVKTSSINDHILNYEKTIERREAVINKKTIDKKSYEERRDELLNYLRSHDQTAINDMQARLKELKEDIKQMRKIKNKHSEDFHNWLLMYNTLIRLQRSIKISIDKCVLWESEGQIPLAVSSQTLKRILDTEPPRCICGTGLTVGSKEREQLEELLGKNLIESTVIQDISSGRGLWQDILDELDQDTLITNFKKLKSERDEYDKNIELKRSEEKTIIQKLAEHDQDEVRRYAHELREIDEKKSNCDREIALAERELQIAQEKCNEMYAERKKEIEQNKKYSSYNNRIDLANTLSKIFGRIYDDLINEFRDTVSIKTTEYFKRLVNREDFLEVEIKPNYSTVVLDHDLKSKDLSAGQSCCLALSYIAAIREISGRDYFMMIDSPLHNISQTERIDIAKNLPKFLPQTQITLLVQDQEYTGVAKKQIEGEELPSVRKILMENRSIWKEYVLETYKDQGDVADNTRILEVNQNG